MTDVVAATKQHALIVDVSTLDSLADAHQQEIDNKFIVTNRNPDTILPNAIQYLQGSRTLQEYLMFLESLVLFDVLLFDKHAAVVARVEIPPELSPFVQGIDVPTDIYHRAAVAVEEAKRKLRDEKTPPSIRSLTSLSQLGAEDPFWSGGEKRLHDRFVREHVVGIPPTLANTDDSLGRALFYLEFSRALDTPCRLSSGKRDWLSIIREAVRPTVHEILAKCVDEEVKKAVGEFLAAGPDLPCGPVAEMILRDSIFRREPLSSAAIRIRQSDQGAKEYRQLLAELREELGKGRSGWKRVGEVLNQIRRVTQIWSRTLDFRLEVTRKERKLKLEKLPVIGELLSFAGMDEMTIKDIVLNKPPGYLAFISRWYK
jgi:hypothetical protein